MADVENVSAIAAAATTTEAVTPTEVPVTQGSMCKPIDAEGAGTRNDVITECNQNSNDLGTSPTQEKSSNSHPHDSEYDTASDLEGNEEYDDDDMDESLTEDDEDSEDETETENDDDDDGLDIDLQDQEKLDAEAQKKVDEDRSNPQYIPKRGTFYEHDDRTAELEEGVIVERQEAGESPLVITGGTGSVTGSKTSTTPTISTASKTMKKWQPASAVDRWSHDRFDPSEQAPKSRAELVNAYGYDIRTEDAPPKARRRRRYGRGPSKYNRNWEDESAYLKNNNKERKPPKASDFPALNEKSSKPRRPRRTREEKENRMEKRKRDVNTGEGRIERTDKMGPSSRNNHIDDHDHRGEPRSDRSEKNNEGSFKQQNRQKSYNNRGHGQNQASVGRQAAMEFKQKNRQNYQTSTTGQSNINSSSLSSRLDAQRQPQQPQQQQQQTQSVKKSANGSGEPAKEHCQSLSSQNQQQSQVFEGYNNKKKNLEQGFPPVQGAQQQSPLPQQLMHQQQSQHSSMLNHNVNRQISQIQNKTSQPTSNLSQRLQQVQNRNDPSHVGSVQMHALATQNQQQHQQQQIMQQQAANILMPGATQQPQNQNISQQPMEQRGPPKRYSSLRRSQHDAQHIADHPQQQQQLHQIHMQQQQQQSQAPPSMMIPADQAMLQANLMQMYHQENLQAQMQALQVTQQPAVSKQPNYVAQGSQAPTQQPYPGATPTPTAYYVASPDAYTAAATAAVTAQATQAAATYAAQQANPNFLAQQQTTAAASLVYNNPNNTPQQAVPSATAYGPTGQVGVVTQPQAGSTAPGGYQNYNTVGGTTYFVPPPTQPSSRPVSLPQRRPTNAIPILPPSEKNKQQKSQDLKTDDSKSSINQQPCSNQPPIGSAENIDHIIDNMFVQRPAFLPQPATTTTPTTANAPSKSPTLSTEGAALTAENFNIANNSPQDNNIPTTENIKPNNENSSAATATSSSVTNTITTTTTESSNNNQMSAQE